MSTGIGDFVDLEIEWYDDTPHGSCLSGRLQRTVRRVLHPRSWRMLAAEMAKESGSRARFDSDSLCRIVREERNDLAHRAIVEDPAFWRPDPARIQPGVVRIRSEECHVHVALPLACDSFAQLGEWLCSGETENVALLNLQRDLQQALDRANYARITLACSDRGPILVGHACVTWSDGKVRFWSDPFLRPKRLRYPLRQQPISPLDTTETEHVVAITHSHPDHFSPTSLLLFPRRTTIIVPHVDCETLLTLDFVLRLRQLGFTDIRTLKWGEQTSVGQFNITALPFYGEQALGPYAPAQGRDRNEGATYHVAGPRGLAALFLADAGADPAGSTLQVARDVRRSLGRVDFLFGNHRRWRVHPPQHLTTSVPQNICFVPDAELGVPQATMLTPQELEVIGAVLGARQIIPYAMGGAPWFAELGLGLETEDRDSDGHFDGHPKEMVRTSDPNTLVTTSVSVMALGAGDGVDAEGSWRDPALTPFDPNAFVLTPRQPIAASRTMAIGGVCERRLVQDLLALTRIDPSAYLIAAPGYVEVVTADGKTAAFLWELASRLVPFPTWVCWASAPLIGGVFRAAPAWLDTFECAHRGVSLALRDGDDPMGALSQSVEQLRAGLQPDLIESIARELLGITVRVRTRSRGRAMHAPEGRANLPPAAAPLIAKYGADSVSLALMVIKLIHNSVLTARAIGRTDVRDETAVFTTLLASDG